MTVAEARPVVVPSSSQPSRLRPLASPHAAHVRASWLVLAVDGPAIQVPVEVPGTAIRVVGDPVRFRAMLLAERPRIVVCSEPPADRATLELVVAERRRRSRMRAVHLAPPDAVDRRL